MVSLGDGAETVCLILINWLVSSQHREGAPSETREVGSWGEDELGALLALIYSADGAARVRRLTGVYCSSPVALRMLGSLFSRSLCVAKYILVQNTNDCSSTRPKHSHQAK